MTGMPLLREYFPTSTVSKRDKGKFETALTKQLISGKEQNATADFGNLSWL